MMGEPNPKAKWSKYSISDDGTLERKAEHCPNCGKVSFSEHTLTARRVVGVATPSRMNDASIHHL